jgi:hypothetical protein
MKQSLNCVYHQRAFRKRIRLLIVGIAFAIFLLLAELLPARSPHMSIPNTIKAGVTIRESSS